MAKSFARALQHVSTADIRAYTRRKSHAAGPPSRQGRTAEADALPGIDLHLWIKRQMIGIIGDENMRDRRIPRHAAFD